MRELPAFLSDDQPHEDARSSGQIAGVLELLGSPPKRVLELGCGRGRVLLPVAAAGHDVTGIDWNAESIRACQSALRRRAKTRAGAQLIEGDFTNPGVWPSGNFDAVLCLGNTFMLLADVTKAVEVLVRAARSLAPAGVFILDDLPHDFWPELTEGNWQSGISEDGEMQLLWEDGDSVFALRMGEDVQPDNWSIAPDERRYRLWSMGALSLAAMLAGLSAPNRLAEASVLVMQRTA
jgi:SAM-dependent methyltransferase